jgi:hypothetical protein
LYQCFDVVQERPIGAVGQADAGVLALEGADGIGVAQPPASFDAGVFGMIRRQRGLVGGIALVDVIP